MYMHIHVHVRMGSKGKNVCLTPFSDTCILCNVHVYVHVCAYPAWIHMYMIKSMRPIQYKARQHNNTS